MNPVPMAVGIPVQGKLAPPTFGQEIEGLLTQQNKVIAAASIPIVGGAMIGAFVHGTIGAGIGAFVGLLIPAYIITHIGFSK